MWVCIYRGEAILMDSGGQVAGGDWSGGEASSSRGPVSSGDAAESSICSCVPPGAKLQVKGTHQISFSHDCLKVSVWEMDVSEALKIRVGSLGVCYCVLINQIYDVCRVLLVIFLMVFSH